MLSPFLIVFKLKAYHWYTIIGFALIALYKKIVRDIIMIPHKLTNELNRIWLFLLWFVFWRVFNAVNCEDELPCKFLPVDIEFIHYVVIICLAACKICSKEIKVESEWWFVWTVLCIYQIVTIIGISEFSEIPIILIFRNARHILLSIT